MPLHCHANNRLWHLNNAQLVLRGPKCAKKISPTPLHHQYQPEPLRRGRMDPCFHVRYAKFWPYHLNVTAEIETHQTRQRFSNLLLSRLWWVLCELYPPFPVLNWQERHPVWSSAAVAHLLQGSNVLCVQRWYSAYPWLLQSGYLSYLCLSIISNKSAHSSSDINKPFLTTQLPLTGYFLFFGPFSVNPRDSCELKIPCRSAVFEILRSTTTPCSKSLKSPFFLILMLGLNFSKSSSPHLDA